MALEFSNLKKTRNLILVYLIFTLIFLIVCNLLKYYEVNAATIKIVKFGLTIYAIIIAAFASITFDTKISHKIFQGLLLFGIMTIAISIFSFISAGFAHSIDLTNLRNLPAAIAGLYLLFCATIGQAGTSEA